MIPKILDRFEEKLGILPDCIDGIAIEERNGMCEIEITYPIFSLNWNKILRGNIIVADVNDTLVDQKFRIYKVSKPINGKIKVYAKHVFFDLARDFIENIELSNASCEYALNTLFRSSQFSQSFTGHSDIVNAQDYKLDNINLIKCIGGTKGSIIDTFGTGAEILRDNKKVYVLNRRGHDNNVTIEYSKNMTGLNVDFDDSKLITRIKPIAKYNDENNKEVIVFSNPKYVDSPLVSNYETPFICLIDFTDKFKNGEVPTPEKLKLLAEKYFIENKCDQVKTNIKVEFIPLSKCVGYKNLQDKISLCDIVAIKDYRYKLDTQAKVIKTYYNFIADRYEKIELGETKTSLGDLIGNENGDNPSGNTPSKPPLISDESFPDTLPTIPTLNFKLYGFSSIELSWTFENKGYYNYELYASKTKNFTANAFDLLFKGQASTFLHSVKAGDVWYYKVRAINSHGKATALSNEVEVISRKEDDFENYFSSLAVKDLVVNMFSVDYMEAGIIHGNWINAKQLSVTDGNGKRTLDIDSFGNVNLDVSSFKVRSENVFTQNETTDKINKAIKDYKVVVDKEFDDVINAYVDLESEMNGAFKDGLISQSEAISIKNRIVQLEKEKADIEKEFNTVYNNANLNDTTEKENLLKSYNDYVEKFRNLKETILNAITDNLINQGEITLINDKTDLYKLSSAKFKEDFTKAIDKVGSIKSSKAETNAKNYASSEIKQTADIINSSVNKVSNAGIKNLVSYTDFEVKNLIKENWWIQGNGNWYESENANLIGFQNNYSTETMIHSKAIKDFESKVSIFADIKIENADCEIMILGSRSDELDYAYTLSALRFTTKHTQDKKWLEAITIPPNIKTLWVRIDNEGVKTGDTNKNNTIFVNALTLVNGDIARKEKILNGSEVADISIKSKEIELSVKEKVNEKELISKINMSSEKIKILSKFLELTGYATFKDLLNEGSTEINGSNIVTGILKALEIEACHFTGKNMVYIEENGILSCDGQTYIRDFFVPETHPGWNPNSRGSFSVAPSAFFDKDVHAGGEVYTKGSGVVRRENGVFIQVDALGVQSGDPNNYLLVKAYQSNHVFGVDLWYSDEKLKENITNLKTRPFKNVLTGLDLVKSIEHYSYNYKESVGLGTGQVDCGYIAQQLQKVNPTLVREVKQQDDSINLEPVASAIIPNLTMAIQEQQSYIESLEARLLKLEQLI